jgi:hypothetical protein
MKPRGRPFPPGNKMGRGRPKGSRNKSKSAEQQLLEQWRLPMIAQCIRRASDGHFPSLRLFMSLLQNAPHKRSTRSIKMQTFEDLMQIAEGRCSRGTGARLRMRKRKLDTLFSDAVRNATQFLAITTQTSPLLAIRSRSCPKRFGAFGVSLHVGIRLWSPIDLWMSFG